MHVISTDSSKSNHSCLGVQKPLSHVHSVCSWEDFIQVSVHWKVFSYLVFATELMRWAVSSTVNVQVSCVSLHGSKPAGCCRILPLDGLFFSILRGKIRLKYIILGVKINVKKSSLAKIENTVLSIWDSKNNEGDNFGTEPRYVHLPEQKDLVWWESSCSCVYHSWRGMIKSTCSYFAIKTCLPWALKAPWIIKWNYFLTLNKNHCHQV